MPLLLLVGIFNFSNNYMPLQLGLTFGSNCVDSRPIIAPEEGNNFPYLFLSC